jgi:hypothetical protein
MTAYHGWLAWLRWCQARDSRLFNRTSFAWVWAMPRVRGLAAPVWCN